jgi:hypothetical protein
MFSFQQQGQPIYSVGGIYSAIREKQGDSSCVWQDFIEISRKPRIGRHCLAGLMPVRPSLAEWSQALSVP